MSPLQIPAGTLPHNTKPQVSDPPPSPNPRQPDKLRSEGVELTGDGGLLTGLVRQVLQCGLEVEMAEHLGYERHAVEGRGTPNSRNGSSPKRVKTEVGEVDLRVPRDRAGTFEPVTVPKHQRRLDGLSGNVISLYAK